MEFKYKILQNCEGYKIVQFQHSFYNGLKKTLIKQSNKYYNMLNPATNNKDKYTAIPTQYNPEDVKNSMIVQNTIEEEAIGFLIDDSEDNVVFDKISYKLNNNSINDYCAIKMGNANIIICPDDINSVNILKNIVVEEIINYKTSNIIKNNSFVVSEISLTEQDFIQNKMKELLIDAIDRDVEISEDLVALTQLPLCKAVINKKKIKDVLKLFEILGIANAIINNSIYFYKADKAQVNEYINKIFNGEIQIKDEVAYKYDQNLESVAIEPVQQEKHKFEYKNIEEVIHSKSDLAVKNQNIEWIEPEQMI